MTFFFFFFLPFSLLHSVLFRSSSRCCMLLCSDLARRVIHGFGVSLHILLSPPPFFSPAKEEEQEAAGAERRGWSLCSHTCLCLLLAHFSYTVTNRFDCNRRNRKKKKNLSLFLHLLLHLRHCKKEMRAEQLSTPPTGGPTTAAPFHSLESFYFYFNRFVQMNNRKNSKGANRIVSEGHQQQLLRK